MKSRRPLPWLASLTPIAATLSMVVSTQAATDTWTGATNGTWDTVTSNWLDDETDTLFNSGNDALFTGTPTNNVTTATGLTIGSITLDNTFTGSVSMTGANTVNGATTISGGTLNLNNATGLGSSAITVNNGGALNLTNLSYANAVSGAGTANVSGTTGDATLTGNWSGFTGTLNLSGSGNFKTRFTTTQPNLISNSATINVGAGTTLYLNQALNYGAGVHLFGAGNTENLGALRLEAGANQTGSVTLHANSFIGANGSAATISGNIGETGGSFGFTKQGNNTLILTGNNTYTGATVLSAGTLSVSSDSAGAYNLGGAGTNGITFDGGTLQVTGTAITNFGSHTPTFNATKTVGLDIANAANNFTVSQVLNQTTGGLTKSGAGTLTLTNANTFTGAVTVAGGTLVVSNQLSGTNTSNAQFRVGTVSGTGATLKINAGASITNRHNLFVGDAGAGTGGGAVYQSGGTLTLNQGANVDNLRIGSNAGGYGYYKLSGGTLTTNEAGIGASLNGTTGVMDVTGGTFTSNGWITVGRGGTTSSGVLNVTGGAVEFSKTAGAADANNSRLGLGWAGSGSQAIVNIANGSVTGDDYIDLAAANNTGALGVINLLSGGTLQGSRVTASNGNPTALFNFNGGTLKAHSTNAGANFMNSANIDAVTVYSGGGTIDNNSTNITIGRPLAAASGNGVTSIAVTNGGSGYIGAPLVTITGGTGNTATGYAVMEDDGTGNGTFRVASIVVTSPGTYSVDPTTVTLTGGGASTAATLGAITTAANTSGGMTFTGSGTTTLTGVNTYTGATVINSGTLMGATGNVQFNGSLSATSGITVNNGATLSSTENGLFGWGGTTEKTITVNSGGTMTAAAGVNVNVGTVVLNGGTMTNGGAAANWGSWTFRHAGDKISVTEDSVVSAQNVFMKNGASIDVASGKNLNFTGTLTNTTSDGTGALIKEGAGTLTLANTNTYSGTTTVTGGVLALGSGGSIANSSEIALNGGNFNVSAVAGFSLGAGQALTGNGGSVTGDIIVNGTLAIGSSPGTMTFNDDLTIGGSAISNFEFTDIGLGLGTYDFAQGGVGAQTVTFGGTLNLLFSGGTYANNSSVQIFNFENYSGGFTTVNFSGLGAGQSAVFNASTGFVTVIPEPGPAALLGGFGVLALLRRRRH